MTANLKHTSKSKEISPTGFWNLANFSLVASSLLMLSSCNQKEQIIKPEPINELAKAERVIRSTSAFTILNEIQNIFDSGPIARTPIAEALLTNTDKNSIRSFLTTLSHPVLNSGPETQKTSGLEMLIALSNDKIELSRIVQREFHADLRQNCLQYLRDLTFSSSVDNSLDTNLERMRNGLNSLKLIKIIGMEIDPEVQKLAKEVCKNIESIDEQGKEVSINSFYRARIAIREYLSYAYSIHQNGTGISSWFLNAKP